MNLTLIRSMTRSAVFELENELCYRPAHPFTVALNGKTVYEACNTNVFSLFSLLPGTTYTVEVQAEGETLKLDFTTEAETFFVDAARYGLVADGETDNTVRLQAALSTCPAGGTVYVPAGTYRTQSLFLQSSTVWGKQLYPEDARGQFEGIRILFFVLIPMVVAPLIANPIIKKSGEFVDENGLTAYLPTYTLLLVGAALVLLTVIPLIPAKKYHDRRISEKKAEGGK